MRAKLEKYNKYWKLHKNRETGEKRQFRTKKVESKKFSPFCKIRIAFLVLL